MVAAGAGYGDRSLFCAHGSRGRVPLNLCERFGSGKYEVSGHLAAERLLFWSGLPTFRVAVVGEVGVKKPISGY